MKFADLKLCLFDLDGTLVEFPKRFLFTQTEHVFSEMSLPPASLAAMEQSFKEFDFFRIVAEDRREEFMKLYWERFDWNQYPAARVLPGAAKSLSFLKSQGLQVAIVTSRHEAEHMIRSGLEGSGLLEHIDHIEPRTNLSGEWSNKVPQIQATCQKLSIAPELCLLTGDVPPDIKSAREAGVKESWAVLSGGISKSVLAASKPDQLLHSVAEIPALFQQLSRK